MWAKNVAMTDVAGPVASAPVERLVFRELALAQIQVAGQILPLRAKENVVDKAQADAGVTIIVFRRAIAVLILMHAAQVVAPPIPRPVTDFQRQVPPPAHLASHMKVAAIIWVAWFGVKVEPFIA